VRSHVILDRTWVFGFSLCSFNISLSVLHAFALHMAVGPLLHIFIVIFSLFGSHFQSCVPSRCVVGGTYVDEREYKFLQRRQYKQPQQMNPGHAKLTSASQMMCWMNFHWNTSANY
jgi:hypothetical protein